MMENRKIDVIIPAYNVPDNILFRCLSSIACQDIIEDLEITIVDDASTKQNYKNIAKHFAPSLKINVLRYETNGGPGVARQYGIDNTSNPYLTFIDADDTLNGSFALRTLRNGLEKHNSHYVCVGIFDELIDTENPIDGPRYIEHRNDLVWMFGKLYKRSFINKYRIRFHPTSRANEDTGFNTIVKLCENNLEKIYFIQNHVYNWHENPNSITRINNCEYNYISTERGSFYGYVENMIYAIKHCENRSKDKNQLYDWKVFCMINLYHFYLSCIKESREHAEKNLKWCKRYYDEIYKKIEENGIPDKVLNNTFTRVFKDAYHSSSLDDIIPKITYFEFLNKLKELKE